MFRWSRALQRIVWRRCGAREGRRRGGGHPPGPARPGRVSGVHVSAHGRSFRIAFGKAVGASHYLVRLTSSDGRRILRIISRDAHRLTVPALGYEDRLAATVTGVSSYPRSGPRATATAEYRSAVYGRAHAPARARRPIAR
jgi:hypothetical protein